jgi:hypothetical protein
MSTQKEKMSTGKVVFTVVMSVILAGMTIYFDWELNRIIGENTGK